MKYRFIYLPLTIIWFNACQKASSVNNSASKESTPPNIILLIGDGMGLSQVSAAYYYGKSEPSFSAFPHIGLLNTSSSSHRVTDSGAGATAFSTGRRTFNGAIGVGPDSLPVKNLPEILKDLGYVSGLVATCQLTHATPAAFFAHHHNRDDEYVIATQLHRSAIDFAAAGGYGYFMGKDANYLDSLTQSGFRIDTSSVKFPSDFDPQSKLLYLPARYSLPAMKDGRADFSREALGTALQYFSEKDAPFFLMIEGAQIDWGGHDNDAEYLISEMIDFERVIKTALHYAAKDGNTVVIVLADHETGGFTLSEPDGKDMYGTVDSIVPVFASGGHSASLIPVFAYGPSAEIFTGIYPNTAIFDKILKLTSKQE